MLHEANSRWQPKASAYLFAIFHGHILGRTRLLSVLCLVYRSRSATMPLFTAAFSAPVPLFSLQSSVLDISTASRCFQSHRRVRCRKSGLSMSADGDEGEEPRFSVQNRDWREFRATLVAGSSSNFERAKKEAHREGHWAHPIPVPETGCFLASHPAYYRRSAPYLTQAVVFLTSYNPELGATGLVLNRPLRGTASELESMGMFGRSARVSNTSVANEPVYAGGPDLCETKIITAMHSDLGLLNGLSIQQPLPGVFITDALQLVQRVPHSDVSSVRLFSGCIRWKKGELEREVDDGSWYCISASKLFALEHCIQLPKPLWVEIMQSQGQPFAAIAARVLERGAEGGDTNKS